MVRFPLVEIPTFSDPRGSLCVLDGVLPFSLNRIYWIYDSDGLRRGGHRHKCCRQALIAVKGTVSVFMDDGNASETVILERPDRYLLVEPEHWHAMILEKGAVLLVLASHRFDLEDYIWEPYATAQHAYTQDKL